MAGSGEKMIPLGKTAKSWVCARSDQSAVRLRYKAFMAWQAFWFDRNWELQKATAPRHPLLSDPVFIIGLWRSGTTFLHDLLAAHSNFYTPETWQCMAPSTFVLMGLPNRSKAIRRPMDHQIIGTRSPQEDEFALMAMGIPSAYLGFFRPDRLGELKYVLEPDYWLQQHERQWYGEWLHFLEMLPRAPQKHLLLKSPNHVFRLPSLAKLFPRAKWIYLYRGATSCLQSNRKMWNAMFDEYSVTHRRTEALDDFLASACDGLVSSLDWGVRNLPDSSIIGIDLDVLSKDPLITVQRILKFLNIEDDEDRLRSLCLDRRGFPLGQDHKFDEPLTEQLRDASRVVDDKHQGMFGRGGNGN